MQQSQSLEGKIARKRQTIDKLTVELKALVTKEEARRKRELQKHLLESSKAIEERAGVSLDAGTCEVLGDLLARLAEGGPAADALRAEAARCHEERELAASEAGSSEGEVESDEA